MSPSSVGMYYKSPEIAPLAQPANPRPPERKPLQALGEPSPPYCSWRFTSEALIP